VGKGTDPNNKTEGAIEPCISKWGMREGKYRKKKERLKKISFWGRGRIRKPSIPIEEEKKTIEGEKTRGSGKPIDKPAPEWLQKKL